MVVDTSVLLAILFSEPTGEWAAERLEEHRAELRMSTVNLTETLIRLRDRQPHHCFAYALATVENCPILATDRDFRNVDRPVLIPDKV